jgi:hypothetical protein
LASPLPDILRRRSAGAGTSHRPETAR